MAKKMSIVEIQNSPRECGNLISEYLKYTEAGETPPNFSVWAIMHAISAALSGNTYIHMNTFVIKPNMYIFFVAPPGVVSKSTAAGMATRLVKQHPSIHYGPDSATWQALFQEMIDIEQTYQVGKDKQKQSNMNLSISELGTLIDFSDDVMIDTLVDLWDAQEGTKERATLGGGKQTIHNPWLNMIGCTTPAWVQRNIPDYAIGGGFVSRSIFVYADKKEKLVAYPFLNTSHKEQKELGLKLTRELIRISGLHGEFKLNEDAIRWGVHWYEEHHRNPDPHLRKLDGYAARKQVHMHKIAMCLSAAESNDMIITEAHLIKADQILKTAEKDMLSVLEATADDPIVKISQAILSLLMKHKDGYSENELRRYFSGKVSGQKFEWALQDLVKAGLINLVNGGDSTFPPYRLTRSFRKELEESGKGVAGINLHEILKRDQAKDETKK